MGTKGKGAKTYEFYEELLSLYKSRLLIKNMSFFLTLLPLLSFTLINEINSDYKVVPTRSEWNETCMATELKENGYDNRLNNGKVWGSSIDKGFAQSKCTCRHEHVKDLGVMNFDDFVSAHQKCREEFAEDYIQTFTKYLQIHLNERDKK